MSSQLQIAQLEKLMAHDITREEIAKRNFKSSRARKRFFSRNAMMLKEKIEAADPEYFDLDNEDLILAGADNMRKRFYWKVAAGWLNFKNLFGGEK